MLGALHVESPNTPGAGIEVVARLAVRVLLVDADRDYRVVDKIIGFLWDDATFWLVCFVVDYDGGVELRVVEDERGVDVED